MGLAWLGWVVLTDVFTRWLTWSTTFCGCFGCPPRILIVFFSRLQTPFPPRHGEEHVVHDARFPCPQETLTYLSHLRTLPITRYMWKHAFIPSSPLIPPRVFTPNRSVTYLMRCLCVTLTSLPGPAPHCEAMSTYDPPQGWHDVATRLGPLMGDFRTCGDLLFSGHTAWTTVSMLLVRQRSRRPVATSGRGCTQLLLFHGVGGGSLVW